MGWLDTFQKGGKIKDERLEAIKPQDNMYVKPSFTDANIKKPIKTEKEQRAKFNKLPKEQQERILYNQYAEKHGDIKPAENQSTANKTWEVLTHPMTAAGYVARNENLPDNFSRGEINAHETATNLVNPFFYADEAKNLVKNVATGHPVDASMNALNVLPLAYEYKSLQKLGKVLGPEEKLLNDSSIQKQFIQPTSKFSQSELSSEMEPWLSKYVKPISREEEIFRTSMGRQYYNKKLLEDTVHLDKKGNVISNPDKEGFSLSYEQILKLPDEEILNKTGKSKEDWKLYIEHKPERYSKSLEDTFNSSYEPSSKQLESVHKGKQQLLNFYNSNDYRNRLQNATGLDFDSTINKQTDLINAVNKTKPRYVQSTGYKSLDSDAKAYTSGADSEGTKLGIDFSDRGLNRTDAEYLSSHEFGHTSLYDIKNKDLLEKLPKLDLDVETKSNWEKWGNESKDNSYHDMINYYSNPDEARQRGINAIMYSKNNGISTDELVDIPYNNIIEGHRSGKIPKDIMELRQLYDQKQLKDYLKNIFTVTGIGAVGTSQLEEKKNGGWLSKYEQGGVIKDDRGQWAHPGEVTEIGSNNITMQGVGYPVMGVSKQTGEKKLMLPEKNYKFANTKQVVEFPMMNWLDKYE